MKARTALFISFVALLVFGAVAPVFAQTTVRPVVRQFESLGHPRGVVVVRGSDEYDVEVLVEWKDLKINYQFTVDAGNNAEVELPSYVKLRVKAWAWVYKSNGRRERKELKFDWYRDEETGKTILWFPKFK